MLYSRVIVVYFGRKYVTKLRCHILPQEVGYFKRKERMERHRLYHSILLIYMYII